MILVAIYIAFSFTELVTFPYNQKYLEYNGFFAYLMDRIEPYVGGLSDRGVGVVAALTHWCGWMWPSTPDKKCYVRGCDRYYREALADKKGTDARLRRALVSHRECLRRQGSSYRWKADRITREIGFLDG